MFTLKPKPKKTSTTPTSTDPREAQFQAARRAAGCKW